MHVCSRKKGNWICRGRCLISQFPILFWPWPEKEKNWESWVGSGGKGKIEYWGGCGGKWNFWTTVRLFMTRSVFLWGMCVSSSGFFLSNPLPIYGRRAARALGKWWFTLNLLRRSRQLCRFLRRRIFLRPPSSELFFFQFLSNLGPR